MTEFLDRPLYFLDRSHLGVFAGVLDPALLRTKGKRVALFFTGEERARAHLSALPKTVTVQCAADHRAKEELFEAALTQGAAELWLDAAPDGEPVLTYSLKQARNYILSFKQHSACL